MKKTYYIIPLIALISGCANNSSTFNGDAFERVRGTKISEKTKNTILDKFGGYIIHETNTTTYSDPKYPDSTHNNTVHLELNKTEEKGSIKWYFNSDEFFYYINYNSQNDPQYTGRCYELDNSLLESAFKTYETMTFSWCCHFYSGSSTAAVENLSVKYEETEGFKEAIKPLKISGNVSKGKFSISLSKPVEMHEEYFTGTFAKYHMSYDGYLLREYGYTLTRNIEVSNSESVIWTYVVSNTIEYL